MKSRPFMLFITFIFFFFCPLSTPAQQPDSLLSHATLQNVVKYTLEKQIVIQQSLLDEEITDLQIRSRLADWYPQIGFNYLYQHNFQVQTSVIGGNAVRLGVNNTSAMQFAASQFLFNRDVLLANRTKGDVRLQARQLTENAKIDAIVNVIKAFYDVVVTEQQRKVARRNIVRLERSLKDTRARYDAGVTDKTDYKRATIALNNSNALEKANEEALKSKTEYLKFLMSYPEAERLDIIYDSAALDDEIYIDTLQLIDYSRRIEYQLLQTQRRLREANLKYNRWSYIPSLSANGAYNLNFFNNSFGKLYNESFPNSYAGLTLGFPIFQGGKRKYNIRQAERELKRSDLELVNLENSINAEYVGALADYKGNLANYQALKENVLLAQEVYDVTELQYQSGIKAYLEVVASETDLRTAQINYFNALYQLMSSKVDVRRSLGQVDPLSP